HTRFSRDWSSDVCSSDLAMPSAITPSNADLPVPDHADFAALSELLLATVAASSARVYAQTLRAWQSWCAAQGFDPMDLTPRQVQIGRASCREGGWRRSER